MAEKKFVVPEILPILPVRDTVLFPGAVLPLTVGRESSLALVNSLQGDEKLLGVVAQLDPRVEDPAAADLHKLYVAARHFYGLMQLVQRSEFVEIGCWGVVVVRGRLGEQCQERLVI